jgi:hypothetical protein
MKSSNLFLVLFFVFILFIAGCMKNTQNKSAEGDLDFKKMCTDAGYEWMLMKPTQDGKFIKDAQECWGCMVEGIEHICDKEKFYNFIPTR